MFIYEIKLKEHQKGDCVQHVLLTSESAEGEIVCNMPQPACRTGTAMLYKT